MSEMRYRRQIRSIAEMAPQPYHQQQFLLAMLESQLPVQTQLEWVFRCDDFEVIEYAMLAATQLALHALAPAVINAFERWPDIKARSWWLTHFGVLDHPLMDRFLLDTLQTSSNQDLRKCAAVALRDGTRPDTIVPLLAIAQNIHEPPELRGEVLEALAYQGDETLVPQILPFLQAPEANIRWDALYTVGQLGNMDYASAIEPLLNDTTVVFGANGTIADDVREILERWETCVRIGGIGWQLRRGASDE